MFDTIWINARLALVDEGNGTNLIDGGAIAAKDGLIAMVEPMAELRCPAHILANRVIDVQGRCITPGLIDCHTHIVFGGNRSSEYEMRLQGKSYEEIAAQGGGIMSSVVSTRDASEEELESSAKGRLINLIKDGVTTVEIKSGYGLDEMAERKMLRVARRLGETLPLTVKTSFLGAHALPAEYVHGRDDYIDLVCDQMLPKLYSEGLVDAVDAYCEGIAFSLAEVERVFNAAASYRIPVKLHAEQFSDSGGAILAARFNALSADHLEYLSESGAKAMAESGTVAVLLPGAYFMLRETRMPPVSLLRDHKIPIAIASDCNPGSSPVLSPSLMMCMACQLFGLVPEEALQGMTINAARALGIERQRGSLKKGKLADMVVWNVDQPSELSYWLGGNKVCSVIKEGISVHEDVAEKW